MARRKVAPRKRLELPRWPKMARRSPQGRRPNRKNLKTSMTMANQCILRSSTPGQAQKNANKAPGRPMIAPERSKMAPRWPKRAPRWRQDGPGDHRDARMAPGPPKVTQHGQTMAPRSPRGDPRRAPVGPMMAPRGSRRVCIKISKLQHIEMLKACLAVMLKC